jgi:hypothetical protein
MTGCLLGDLATTGTTVEECAVVAADVLNWFDGYMRSMLGLGGVRLKRFSPAESVNLNAYSM